MSVPTESSPVRIALIDDDSGLLTVITRRFEALRWQSQVLPYPPASEHLAAMRLHALLVNPALTGLEYVERVAEALPGMALLVVSPPTTVANRVRGLRVGADDWITKPCHPEELLARVQAVMRRRRLGDLPDEDRTTEAGELMIRPDRFDAYAGDQAAGLSRREYDLLRQLALVDGRVLERERIYERVWGYTMVRGDRSVDVFVRKLRAKLERVSPEWRYVHTHFGIGYRFAAEPVEGSAAAQAHAQARAATVLEADGTAPGAAANGAQTEVPFDLQLIN
ncbi:MAG TPA: response regulator transcription factor [Solirubrobacteraceae bacterium]|jgi:DNA-binding response OmpR family regulator|nr:response regulator transcription factor [Solirubrobacteraceae bacterium]